VTAILQRRRWVEWVVIVFVVSWLALLAWRLLVHGAPIPAGTRKTSSPSAATRGTSE